MRRQTNVPNQLGAVSDPPENGPVGGSGASGAARALSGKLGKAGGPGRRRGGGRGAAGVRAARTSIAGLTQSVRRGGRRKRACDALSLTWPALGRSWPSAGAGGG